MTDSIFIKGGFDLPQLNKRMKLLKHTADTTNGTQGDDGCGMGKSGVGFNDGSGESPDGVIIDGRQGRSARGLYLP